MLSSKIVKMSYVIQKTIITRDSDDSTLKSERWRKTMKRSENAEKSFSGKCFRLRATERGDSALNRYDSILSSECKKKKNNEKRKD